MTLEMDAKLLEMSICKSWTKMNVKILMMVHVTCFLLNLPVVKMNIQKNGADILTIIIVNVDDTI